MNVEFFHARSIRPRDFACSATFGAAPYSTGERKPHIQTLRKTPKFPGNRISSQNPHTEREPPRAVAILRARVAEFEAAAAHQDQIARQKTHTQNIQNQADHDEKFGHDHSRSHSRR